MTKIQLTKNPLAKLPPTDYPTDKNPQLPNSDKNPAFSQHHTSSLKNKLKKENPGFFLSEFGNWGFLLAGFLFSSPEHF